MATKKKRVRGRAGGRAIVERKQRGGRTSRADEIRSTIEGRGTAPGRRETAGRGLEVTRPGDTDVEETSLALGMTDSSVDVNEVEVDLDEG